jgi:hypothetical protein
MPARTALSDAFTGTSGGSADFRCRLPQVNNGEPHLLNAVVRMRCLKIDL